MAVVSIALDSHGNTMKIQMAKKVRTLLAGYTFIGFALLCFQTVTSCPMSQRPIFNWLRDQTINLLSI